MIVLVTALLLLSPAFSAMDCSSGCVLTGPRVCDDRHVYANECVAACQGVHGITPCPDLQDEIEEVSDEDGVSLETMTRFADSGFVYVGKAQFKNSQTGTPSRRKLQNGSGISDEKLVIKVTRDGHEYRSTFKSQDSSSSGRTSWPGFPGPATSGTTGKNVLGVDSRREILFPESGDYPWRIVSAILEYGSSICSGTVISANTILTSAHCLYGDGFWHLGVDEFVPGLAFDASGSLISPYGIWDWEEKFIVTAYSTTEDFADDMGFIRINPITTYDDDGICTNVFVGDAVGHAGVSVYSMAQLESSRITGYPGDKTEYSMWNAGICAENGEWFVDGKLTAHFCDTAGGMSGSGIITPEHFVVGIHGFGVKDMNGVPTFNGGVVIDQEYFDLLSDNMVTVSDNDRMDCAPVPAPGQEQPSCRNGAFTRLGGGCK